MKYWKIPFVIVVLILFVAYFAYDNSFNKALVEISECKDNYCFQEFFENYTISNGTEKSILFFKALISKNSSYEADCHYMFHGIGHGTLKLVGNDIGKAFVLGSTTDILMNIPTCGNGYYHGVIEEYVGEEEENSDVVGKLKNICSSPSINSHQVEIDCYHGLGHAIFVYYHKNIQNSVSICDSITNNEEMRSMCHTGIFMEMSRTENTDNKVLTFAKCENLPTPMQRAECFNQHSYLLSDFLQMRDAFIENMLDCEKNIKDMEERIICIRKEKI